MAENTQTLQQLALANQYFRSGRAEMAEALLRTIVERDPKSSKAFELLAYVLGNRGQAQACEDMLQKACALPGCSAESFFYLGSSQLQRGAAQEAVRSFETSIGMAGEFFEALHELGVAHSALGKHARALAAFAAAGRKRPDSHEVHFNMGRALEELRRFDEALAHYDQALRIDPRLVHVWANRGVTLSVLGRSQEALASYDRAVALDPGDVDTWMNRAATLGELGRHQDALASFEKVAQLAPATDYLAGRWLHTKMQVCDWSGLPRAFDELIERVGRGEKASPPFPLVATSADRATLLACARTYAKDNHPARPAAAFAPRADAHKIRIGYFSADFHNHATSQLMARMFECHDRARFELFAFSFGEQVQDAMRERLASAFDHFADVSSKSDAEVAAMARAAGLDIAVDLKGFTQGSRPDIFAHRAAPVQVNYLGFPGSMGCEYIDYIVADETLIGIDEFGDYAEKVVLLPNSYQVNDDTKRIAAAPVARAEFGLPEGGFVFACFNNNYKITPKVFDVWMRLLRQVPGSVLWLLRGSEEGRTRLQAEAAARGVDPERLVWAQRMDLAEHLAWHVHADLFLDTLHCNAHTTCSDALWAGLPVLTLAGSTFASRVSSSLLKAIGLPELITHRLADYEALALALASSPQRLGELRQRLAKHRTEFPLFDTARFTRNLEAAFDTMCTRQRQGLAPDHIRVGDTSTTEIKPCSN